MRGLDRRLAVLDVPDRTLAPPRRVLLPELLEEAQIIVARPRDDVEVELLGRARLLVHEERQALRRAVGEPLLDRQAVALGLRDLLALLVEEQLVVEALRRPRPENAARLVSDAHRR